MDTRSAFLTSAVAAGSMIVAASSGLSDMTMRDVVRAHTDVPRPGSHVLGAHPASAYAGMNAFLEDREGLQTSPCEDFDLEELHDVGELILQHKDDKLNAIYKKKDDKRQITSLEEYKQQWAEELEKVDKFPETHGVGTEHHKMTREGKCAEIVMWWIHHLAEGTQTKLQSGDFRLPLMPADHNEEGGDEAYTRRMSCTLCHITPDAGFSDALAPAETADPSSSHIIVPSNALDRGACPIDDETGLPSVWYESEFDVGNRIKRCDPEYDPPCLPCEGRGGHIWGDQKDEWSPNFCRVVGGPDDIREEDRVQPIWPRGFEAEVRYTFIASVPLGGLFPGGSPCDEHAIRNQTLTMYYDGVSDPRGPQMFRSSRGFLDNTENWTLNNFNFYIRLEEIFCVCVTTRDVETRTPLGALRYDWADNSRFVGREEIELEFQDRRVIADHWIKGPHHHWMDVDTGEFVRGWQPWNALNTFFDWKNEIPSPELFRIPAGCYEEGGLNLNVSCIAPPPNEPTLSEF